MKESTVIAFRTTKDKIISFRLDAELYEKILHEAKQEHLKISEMVELMLKIVFEKRKEGKL